MLKVGQHVWVEGQWFRVTLVSASRAHIVPVTKTKVTVPVRGGGERTFTATGHGLDISPNSCLTAKENQ